MLIERVWAMPNKNTFDIPPISKLLDEVVGDKRLWADPFAGNSKIADVRNDLNPDTDAEFHMDALDFLKKLATVRFNGVLYDPPYSPRQVSECYKNFGHSVTQEDTSAKWRRQHLDEIARIVKSGGKCISFGWNSNGVGKKRGFEIERILIVAHGGSHTDTIVTVERKL